ncbi:MAG: flagellar basal body rod protein FlgF [Rhodoferax sp.]|nr:flagellar basal body rod protein FlgF [Rhodoferax sp.]
MDRLIYTAMTGAGTVEQHQRIIANNLANASTNGFREQLTAARAVPVLGDGATTRVMAAQSTVGFKSTPGPSQFTDRPLDAMPQGNAWFAVQGLDGVEGYTRSGSFEVTSTGELVNGSGLTVLSDGGGPITVQPGAQVTLAGDGRLSAKVGNQPATDLGRLKMITPTADDPLFRGDDGLFRTKSGDPAPSDPTAQLKTRYIEGSNVNTVQAMVQMIQVGRQFEVQMRMLQTAESNDRTAAQLLGLQG